MIVNELCTGMINFICIQMVNSMAICAVTHVCPYLYSAKSSLKQVAVSLCRFALAYTLILLLLVDYHPIQWDEVIHLNSGNFLYWGLYDKFILNAFYPPLFDVLEFISFETLGVSLFAARLVPILFSVLALWLVYELANSMYGGKVGLLSAVFLQR